MNISSLARLLFADRAIIAIPLHAQNVARRIMVERYGPRVI